MRAFTLLLPPLGSASVFWHTRHITLDDDFPNIVCSFLHLGHLILTNLLVGSFVDFILIIPRSFLDRKRVYKGFCQGIILKGHIGITRPLSAHFHIIH